MPLLPTADPWHLAAQLNALGVSVPRLCLILSLFLVVFAGPLPTRAEPIFQGRAPWAPGPPDACSSLAVPCAQIDDFNLTLRAAGSGLWGGPGLRRGGAGAFGVTLSLLCGLFLMLRWRGRVLSAPGKVGLGMVLSTVPSLIQWRAALSAPDGGQVSGLWVLGACVALALPGLFLVPVLLSLLSRLLPQRRMATIFGVWTALAGLVNMVTRELGILYLRWEPERYLLQLPQERQLVSALSGHDRGVARERLDSLTAVAVVLGPQRQSRLRVAGVGGPVLLSSCGHEEPTGVWTERTGAP